MLSSFLDKCPVREDITKGRLGISSLAVDLDAIVSKKHATVYDDPKTFFEMTFPTRALCIIARQVFTRISGKDSTVPGIYMLGTALGGGKTHILASLYHMASGGSGTLSVEFKKKLEDLEFPKCRVAVLTQNSPAGEKNAPRTMWGHMASQLGEYDIIKEFDNNLQAPSKEALLELLEGPPTLILLDEVTNYLIRAAAVQSGSKTLAEQTRVFLQDLEEAVALRSNTAIIVSQLPEEFDPLDEKETLEKVTKGKSGVEKEEIERRAMRETKIAQGLLMRKAESYNPVQDDVELVSILRRRIFSKVDKEEAKKVAEAYQEFYGSPGPRGLIPHDALGKNARDRMVDDYPFHPKTISLIRDKLGQAPKFMQTRGSLLLMTYAVRNMMEGKKRSQLIHPSHLDPRDTNIRELLAKRVFDDGRLENAIHTELVGKGEGARAQRIDQVFGTDIGSRITASILLESALVGVKGDADPLVGATKPEIVYDVLEPGEDETRVEKALESILETSYHVIIRNQKYVFRGEVNLNRPIDERKKDIPSYRITNDIKRRMENHVLKGSTPFRHCLWPTSPEDIPDIRQLKLIALAPEDDYWLDSMESKSLDELFFNKNQSKEPRMNKNSLVIVAPNRDQREETEEKVRHSIAVKEISEDKEFAKSLSEEQKKWLEKERSKSEALATLRIGMAYNLLFFPEAEGKYGKPVLKGARLSLGESDIGVDTEEWKIKNSRYLDNVIKRLIDEDKWRIDPYGPDYLVEKVFTTSDRQIDSRKFKDLEGAFFEDTKLPFLASKDILRKTVEDGVTDGSFLVHSGGRLFTSNQAGKMVLHEDSEVIRRGTQRWDEMLETYCFRCGKLTEECECVERCPMCNRPVNECTCESLCPVCKHKKDECTCSRPPMSWRIDDALLKNLPDRASDMLKERGVKASGLKVFANKPSDVAFVLRLIGTLSGRGVEARPDDVMVNISKYGTEKVDISFRASAPAPLWNMLKASTEGMLSKISAGEAKGDASVTLNLVFKDPLGPEELKDRMRAFTMTGGEKVKVNAQIIPKD